MPSPPAHKRCAAHPIWFARIPRLCIEFGRGSKIAPDSFVMYTLRSAQAAASFEGTLSELTGIQPRLLTPSPGPITTAGGLQPLPAVDQLSAAAATPGTVRRSAITLPTPSTSLSLPGAPSPTPSRTPSPAPDPASLARQPWFAGKMNHATTETILLSKQEGAFMVRNSLSRSGYSMSVLVGGQVLHIRIFTDDRGLFRISSHESETGQRSVEKLVEDMMRTGFSIKIHGTPTSVRVLYPFASAPDQTQTRNSSTISQASTDILSAARLGDVSQVEYALRGFSQASRLSIVNCSQAPLLVAAQNGKDDLVRALLANGADVEQENGAGLRPLHGALLAGKEGTACILITTGAKHDAMYRATGQVPLHAAAKHNLVASARALIDRGADLNAIDDALYGPLHVALQSRSEAVASLLIERGANVNARGGVNQETPLQLAGSYHLTRLAAELLARGAERSLHLAGSSPSQPDGGVPSADASAPGLPETPGALLGHPEGAPSGEWACSRCTFCNNEALSICEVCLSPRNLGPAEADSSDASHIAAAEAAAENSQSAESAPPENTVPLCIVCLDSPVNATLVHGESGHSCCCLDCATEIKSRGMPCPVCRAPVDLAIRNYTS